jgi:hypothetical protein
MPSRLHHSIEETAQAIENAVRLLEPLVVNSDTSTVVWPSGKQILAQIEQDLAEGADSETWDRLMTDVAGLLDAEVSNAE